MSMKRSAAAWKARIQLNKAKTPALETLPPSFNQGTSSRKERLAAKKRAKKFARRAKKGLVIKTKETNVSEEGTMDEASFMATVQKHMQEAMLEIDEAKGELSAKDRIQATHLQSAVMLGISMAYMEAFHPEDQRKRIVDMAMQLKRLFKFVDVATGEEQQQPVPSRLWTPKHARIIS